MANSRIDGEGTRENYTAKKNLSRRARTDKLTVKKETCFFCGHHKVFIGNQLGLNKKKCCKCKKEILI
jgi:hypothetical protein